ncbi:sigma-E processing peptidase SpoIIGA [Clostridium grantii]|uniref:sigma-E processing peptidase SpoIIGA n=1 Tax=Clostridium grantii TaxID=40575 RepID=UPI0013563D54|nr:sigma-E processing peptidase SpoIIGA [Clostridium grantii]
MLVVYLDFFILQNLIVNLFLLKLTSKIVKLKRKNGLEILAAFLGTIGSTIGLISAFSFLYSTPSKLVIAFIMICIVYNDKEILFQIKVTAIFIFISMTLAGLCLFIEYNNNLVLFDRLTNFSYKKLLVSIMLIYIFAERIVCYIGDRKKIQKLIYKVEINNKGSVKKIKAFLDTGNELREPATNLPVIIVEESFLKDMLEKQKIDFKIPYSVVNGEKGFMRAFRPDSVTVYYEDKVENRNAIIAICSNKLSDVGDYNALLSREIF